ncbi:MAG: hypothetical protein ABFD06_10965 [Smithella sp.]|jgi:hypothetical protein
MRFMVEILLSGDQLVIPSDYRRNILSLIKEAINPNQSGTDVYNQYYSCQRYYRRKHDPQERLGLPAGSRP